MTFPMSLQYQVDLAFSPSMASGSKTQGPERLRALFRDSWIFCSQIWCHWYITMDDLYFHGPCCGLHNNQRLIPRPLWRCPLYFQILHSPVHAPVHLENPEFQTRWYFKYFLGKCEYCSRHWIRTSFHLGLWECIHAAFHTSGQSMFNLDFLFQCIRIMWVETQTRSRSFSPLW